MSTCLATDGRNAAYSPRRRSRRTTFLIWLRRCHAWIGLWGAALGLLFGVTGILLNHRAALKIPALGNVETQIQLTLSAAPPSPQALALDLAARYGYPSDKAKGRSEPSKEVTWNGQAVRQPERWTVSLDAPNRYVRGEYWVGNTTASVKLYDANVFSTLARLHMVSHHDVAWILLADTLAGGLVFLALSGVLLWTRLAGPKLLAAGLVGGCVAFALAISLSSFV